MPFWASWAMLVAMRHSRSARIARFIVDGGIVVLVFLVIVLLIVLAVRGLQPS